MMAMELDSGCGFGSGSGSGCLSSAALGKTPWPSTVPAAQAAFCAVLPSGCLRQGFAGGSGEQRLHPPGPRDAGKQPPRVWEACDPSLARMSAFLVELWRPDPEVWGKKKLKLTSGLWMVLWMVVKGNSSFQVPTKKNADMFIVVRAFRRMTPTKSYPLGKCWESNVAPNHQHMYFKCYK